jgi:hypothetical protein
MPMNGHDSRLRKKRWFVAIAEPVLKHGPNTACGGQRP